jgi:hypothetical protein
MKLEMGQRGDRNLFNSVIAAETFKSTEKRRIELKESVGMKKSLRN